MTDFVYDRSFYTQGTSSVVDEVFYNTAEKKLVVAIDSERDGRTAVAGYENVPADIFTAFEITNQNKIDGNIGASVGAYWNLWIKPYYKGFDTQGLRLVDVAHVLPVVDNTSAEEVDLGTLTSSLEAQVADQPVTSQPDFTVTFDAGDEITIFAINVNDALVKFNQIAEIAGWDHVVITAVTQHFA